MKNRSVKKIPSFIAAVLTLIFCVLWVHDNSSGLELSGSFPDMSSPELSEAADDEEMAVYVPEGTFFEFEYPFSEIGRAGLRMCLSGQEGEGTVSLVIEDSEGNVVQVSGIGKGVNPITVCQKIVENAEENDSMPAGHYQLTAKMACYTDRLTNQRLFANKYVAYYGYQDDYLLNLTAGEHPTWLDNTPTSSNLLKPVSVDFWLFPGETLTLGIRSSNLLSDGTRVTGNNNAGWFKTDYFRLTLVSTDMADFLAHADSLLDECRQLQSQSMSAQASETLAQAILQGESLTDDSDLTQIQASVNVMIDAIASAHISINLNSLVAQMVQHADQRIALLDNSYDAASYEAVLSPIRSALQEGTLQPEADYQTLILSAVESAIKSQTNPGADMTEVISPTTSLDGWTTTGGDKWQLNTWSTEGSSDGTNMRTPFIEDWVAGSSSRPLQDASISSTVTGLHAGRYRITALLRAYREYSGDGDITGMALYANRDTADMATGMPCVYNTKSGVYNTYEVETTLEEAGDITFGITIQDATFNWFAMKNFTLTYLGEAEPTGITSLQGNTGDNRIYDMQGRMVGTASLRNLHPGLYIINGRKTVVTH